MDDFSRPLRVALIGITGFGARHYTILRDLAREDRVRIDAATIINREEVPDEWHRLETEGTRLYTDYREMLAAESGRIDATFIPTGIAWHEPMTVAALEAGSHVYLEKPAAATLAEVDAMIAARDRAGKTVAVGFQNLSDPGLREAKTRLVEGEIGPLRSISVLGLWPRRQSYYDRNAWAGRIAVEGRPVHDSPANNALAHFLLLGLFLGGTRKDGVPALREIEANLLRAKPIESFDTLSLRGQLETGVSFNCQLTHSCPETHPPRIRVRGRDGHMDWTQGGAFAFSTGAPPIPSLPASRLHKAALTNFVAAIRSGDPVDCSLEMARGQTRLIDRLHAAHSVLPVPDDRIALDDGNADRLIHIPGIETEMAACFEDPTGRRILHPDQSGFPHKAGC